MSDEFLFRSINWMVYDGAADEKYQNNNIHCMKSNFHYFWTCQFAKIESKLKLRKLQLPKDISNDIYRVIFNVCLCGHQMTGLSPYVDKLVQNSSHKHTYTYTHTHNTQLHIHT